MVKGIVHFFLVLLASKVELLPLPALHKGVECFVCKAIIGLAQEGIESNRTFEELYPTIVELCVLALDTSYGNGQYMCPGIIKAYGPVVQSVASQVILDPTSVCKDLRYCESTHQEAKGKGHFMNPLEQEEVTLTKDRYNENITKTSSSANIISFVQLADIHLDPHYSEGSPTDCGLFICCRSWYNGTGSAGHYGSYGCDLPPVTLDLLVSKVLSLDPSPEFVVYTGDNSPHDVWNESYSTQAEASGRIVDYLATKLSPLGVPIYPALGNHESWPESEYIGTLEVYQDLTRYLSDIWDKLVDLTHEAKASIAEGAYYSMKLRDGLRIISFNSDYGYAANLYSFLNSKNPHYERQWEWLAKEMKRAESNQEKVLLIGHIPPGDSDNNADYGERYLNLTKTFKNTIIGHLFGHTHMDHFELVQDEAGVYGVVLVSPSITTYPHINPSFRVYSMNLDTMQLLGYTQYFLNLTRANALHRQGKEAEVQFEVSYTSEQEYQLHTLTPDSLSGLAKRFSTDNVLLSKYNYNKKVRSEEKDRTCDSACRKGHLCDINNVISDHDISCRFS